MGATPITRVLSGDPFRIMKALGAGTQGVIVPLVADADEAARAVAACRYRRDGSAPGSHPSVAALGSSDPEKLTEEVLCLVMVKRGRVSRTWRRSSPPPASTASSLVIPERVVFEKPGHVLVLGCAYWRIADESCSATTLRRIGARSGPPLGRWTRCRDWCSKPTTGS